MRTVSFYAHYNRCDEVRLQNVRVTFSTRKLVLPLWFIRCSFSRSVTKDSLSSFGGLVYEIVDTKRSWTDAEADCVTRGGHLASVTSEDEKYFLRVYASEEYNCNGM